jgi:hypothetical protein
MLSVRRFAEVPPMVLKLSDEIRSALEQQPDSPLTLEDERTRAAYVVIPAQLFERVRGLLYDDDPFEITETYAAQSAVAGATGWDAPGMEMYDDFDRHRSL